MTWSLSANKSAVAVNVVRAVGGPLARVPPTRTIPSNLRVALSHVLRRRQRNAHACGRALGCKAWVSVSHLRHLTHDGPEYDRLMLPDTGHQHTSHVSTDDDTRYEMGDELASGGMGTVHRAFDRLAQRFVAYKRLKVVSEGQRPRMAALFKREYDTLTRLKHPNIVEAYDFGFDAFGPFYTMELLSGDDLTKLAPLPVREACRVLRDIASALALLHARRLVHRDITPNNIRRTSDGRAKLIDFGGLARFGLAQEIVGTAAFIAPECLVNGELDQRTDLFGLGSLAYWVLTGRAYTHARTLQELVDDAWREPILPPSLFAPEIPKALDELVLALLQIDSGARPSSAAEVIDRLTTLAELAPEEDELSVAHGYFQHAPLYGRAQITEELSQMLTQVSLGRGQTLVLSAEQGLGRTALLDHTAIVAQLAGATVLRVQGGVHTESFGTIRRLVKTGLGAFPDLSRQLRLSSLAPARAESGNERPAARSAIDISERNEATASRLAAALVELSRRNPLVLLVDDAHAVDGDSLSFFASMVDGFRHRAILLVLSTRSGEVQDSLAYQKLLSSARCYTLPPLRESQLCELVSSVFGNVPNSKRFAAWLFRQTGGNPGHSIDLARLLLSQGAIRYTVGTFTLPYEPHAPTEAERCGAAALASLSGLSEQAHRIAHLLATHTGALTVDQLARASALSPDVILQALEELVQRGAVHSSGGLFSCASEVLSSALRSSHTSQDKREAHLALAGVFTGDVNSALDQRLAAAQHLLPCGGDEAFQGARLLAQTKFEDMLELAALGSALPLLETALAVLEARRLPDEECVGLLVPLSFAGFYGALDTQRRYLDRTMRVLASICGVTLAGRLRRWTGPKLALGFAMTWALAVHVCSRRAINRRSFAQHIVAFCGIPGAASAAFASAWDARETQSVAAWLDPFAAALEHGIPAFLRQLCLATADIVSGRISAALQRYTRTLEALGRSTPGVPRAIREQLHCGFILGRAQALVTDAAPLALTVADELEARSVHFAPHAEGVRTTFYAYRGEVHQALVHRERAEVLAFRRGGAAWSALTLLAVRWVLASVMAADVVRLVHALADFERLAKLSPSLTALYELAQAHLDQLRGHPRRALPVYERVLASDLARTMPTYPAERALHAQALSAIGDYAEAKALCLALLEEMRTTGHDSDIGFLLVHQQLALAQAGLGDLETAARLLDGCFERVGRYGNPLWLGILHRARAHVAATSQDEETFKRHFAAFEAHFRATNNPCLIQQCDASRAQAAALGLLEASLPTLQEVDGPNAPPPHGSTPQLPNTTAVVWSTK